MSETYYPREGVVSRYQTTVIQELDIIRQKLHAIFSLIGNCSTYRIDGPNGTMVTPVSTTIVTDDGAGLRAVTTRNHVIPGSASTIDRELAKIRWYSGCIHGLLADWDQQDHLVIFPDGRTENSYGIDYICTEGSTVMRHIHGRHTDGAR